MPSVTIRIPARYATIRPGSLGSGVEVLIDTLLLSSLADALNAMEHNDTDPGERRMNADQCRDALLREVLHSWTPLELLAAKIPGVVLMENDFTELRKILEAQQEEIATLTRERDEARALLASGVHTYERNGTIFHEVHPSWDRPKQYPRSCPVGDLVEVRPGVLATPTQGEKA